MWAVEWDVEERRRVIERDGREGGKE